MLSSGGYSSPLHSSQFSLSSSSSTADTTVSRDESPVRLAEPLTEDMISLVVRSPAVVRRWQVLARRAGLANRIQVIQGRIRAEGRDHDEHVRQAMFKWTATGLLNLLCTIIRALFLTVKYCESGLSLNLKLLHWEAS